MRPIEQPRTCKCRQKGKGSKHMNGCPFYQQEAPMPPSKSLKTPSLSKVVSSMEESGLNSNDNVSQNGDTANNDDSVPQKRRPRPKKDKPTMEITEKEDNEDTKQKLKEKRKKEQQQKKLQDSSIATGISRTEQDSVHQIDELK